MEPKGFHRKLTAILSTDVAVYTRLMQDDETATVKPLETYKQIIFNFVKQSHGRPLRREQRNEHRPTECS